MSNVTKEEKKEINEVTEAAEKIRSYCSNKANEWCVMQDGNFCPALKKGRCQVKEILSYMWDF